MTGTIECSETTQEAQYMPYAQILEAIAKGIEARLLRTVVVQIVTIETMCIARRLHIPEEEIQEWRSSRYYRSVSTEDCIFSEFGRGEWKLTRTSGLR